MTKKSTKTPVEIKMATIMAVSAILHSSDTAAIDKTLRTTTGAKDDFFDGEFVVIDVGALGESANSIDWPALLPLFRKYNLNPVAVRNAPVELAAVISAYGLSIDNVAAPVKPQSNDAKPSADSAETSSDLIIQRPMLVDQPVRGGQRVYARGCDMIVTAVVNSGAEIIADGSIYMYAPLRGRALAGASGDTTAKIFASSMEAELVSVAGIYRTFDNGVPNELKGKPLKVLLSGEKLEMLPIDATSKL